MEPLIEAVRWRQTKEFQIIFWVLFAIFFTAAMVARFRKEEKRICPACKMALPKFRKPSSWKEALFGGWSCQGCGHKWNNDLSPKE